MRGVKYTQATREIVYCSCFPEPRLVYRRFLLDVWRLLELVFSLNRDFFVIRKVLYPFMQNSDAVMGSMATEANHGFE